jgi:hypothetical protein
MKIHSAVLELFHADIPIDMVKLMGTYFKFFIANAPKIELKLGL